MFMGAYMQAFAYEFMDEAAFTKHAGYDPIPIKKREKVLASPKGYQVSSVVFLFMAPYDQVVKELKSIATEQFGEFPIVEKRVNEEHDSLKNAMSSGDEEFAAMIAAKLAKFRALNINIEDFRESSFTTKPYNIIDKKTYSVLFVRIANGQDIFGVECTLIFLRRTDHWVDWYREFHTNIPIPWRGPADTYLVTDTEINLIENLKVKMNIRDSAYFFPFSEYSPLAAERMMLKIRETVDKFKGK
jgi:hypothetical protein